MKTSTVVPLIFSLIVVARPPPMDVKGMEAEVEELANKANMKELEAKVKELANMEAKVKAKMEELEAKVKELQADMEANMEARVKAEVEARVKAKVEAMKADMKARVKELEAKVKARVEAKVKAKVKELEVNAKVQDMHAMKVLKEVKAENAILLQALKRLHKGRTEERNEENDAQLLFELHGLLQGAVLQHRHIETEIEQRLETMQTMRVETEIEQTMRQLGLETMRQLPMRQPMRQLPMRQPMRQQTMRQRQTEQNNEASHRPASADFGQAAASSCSGRRGLKSDRITVTVLPLAIGSTIVFLSLFTFHLWRWRQQQAPASITELDGIIAKKR